MEFKDQKFENMTVELDGNTYVRCTFDNVIFQFAGGELNMVDCTMNRFSFQFGGDLAGGLYALYQLFGSEGLIQIIRGFTEPTGGEIEIRR